MAGSGSVNPDKLQGKVEVTNDNDLPQFPGEDFLAHTAALWREQAEARLAKRGLLMVAQGQEPASAKCIIDID